MSEGYGSKRNPGKYLAPSGWCIPGQHELCTQFYYGKWEEHDCSCKCHENAN